MSEEQMKFLSFEQAVSLVAAIQEEEDRDNPEKRVLMVYNHDDKEMCWFDFDETLAAVGPVDKSLVKEAVQNYILKHIPDWVIED